MDNSISNLRKNKEHTMWHNRLGRLTLVASLVFIILQIALVAYSITSDFQTSVFPTRSHTTYSGTLRHVYANEGRELILPFNAPKNITVNVTSHIGSVDIYLLDSDAKEDLPLNKRSIDSHLGVKGESVSFVTTQDNQVIYFDFRKHSGNAEVIYH